MLALSGLLLHGGRDARAPRPDAIVLAILCDHQGQEPKVLVARIIKELRRLHGDKLDKLRDSLKMLEVLAGNRNLQTVVKENVEMYIDTEKLGIYQLVKEKGRAEGLELGEQKVLLQLLKKFSPEQAAELSGVSLEKVRDIAAKGKYQ